MNSYPELNTPHLELAISVFPGKEPFSLQRTLKLDWLV